MILRFGCPRPSALLIHTHALFTLGASGCHLGHNSHLFHLTARRATHSYIWTREAMARTAPSRQRPAFPKESALGAAKRGTRGGRGVIRPWARRYQIRVKAIVPVPAWLCCHRREGWMGENKAWWCRSASLWRHDCGLIWSIWTATGNNSTLYIQAEWKRANKHLGREAFQSFRDAANTIAENNFYNSP